MKGPIKNAADRPLFANTGTVPDLGEVLNTWYQPMIFTKVTKEVENFQNVEVALNVYFRGLWQPFNPRKLSMKPEGQRSWSWFTVHSDTTLVLHPDEVVKYLGTQYRVMGVYDYSLYNYFEYELVQDYSGSGPG